MSDNEKEEQDQDQEYESANESEGEAENSDKEEAIFKENDEEESKDYNSDVEESDDEEEKTKKKPVKAVKVKPSLEKLDEDDIDEAEDDDDGDELEINPFLIDEAKAITTKFSIVVDPRELEDHTRPNPKMKREIVVHPDKRKSSEYLTIYEFCELVGIRAQHISEGAYVYVEIESETCARDIAKKEMQLGCCPFSIKRYMTPMNYDPVYVESWSPNEMAIDHKFFDN